MIRNTFQGLTMNAPCLINNKASLTLSKTLIKRAPNIKLIEVIIAQIVRSIKLVPQV